MPLQTCPSREDLEAFGNGTLGREKSETVTAHLVTCAACRSTLEALAAPHDPLATPLRVARATNPPAAGRQPEGTDLAVTLDKEPCLGRLRNYVLLAEL